MRKRLILLGALSALIAGATLEATKPDSAAALDRRLSPLYCKAVGVVHNTAQRDGTVMAGIAPEEWKMPIYLPQYDRPHPLPLVAAPQLVCPIPNDSGMSTDKTAQLWVDVKRRTEEGSLYAKACRTYYSETGDQWSGCGNSDSVVATGWRRLTPSIKSQWNVPWGMPYVLVGVADLNDRIQGLYVTDVPPEPVEPPL